MMITKSSLPNSTFRLRTRHTSQWSGLYIDDVSEHSPLSTYDTDTDALTVRWRKAGSHDTPPSWSPAQFTQLGLQFEKMLESAGGGHVSASYFCSQSGGVVPSAAHGLSVAL